MEEGGCGEDEEKMKKLEKLPTFDRLKMGFVSSPNGRLQEVNVGSLNVEQRLNLVSKLVGVSAEDNHDFLLKLKSRIVRVGIELPTVEIRFQNLKIEAKARVGSRALQTVFNFYVEIIERILRSMYILSSKKKSLTILNDLSGIIKPSRLTLVLGPPSCGKTTLLLALAGRLDKTLTCSGNVTYNGHEMSEFVPQRTAAYISQDDLHLGELTVRETLAFSARCQGIGTAYDLLSELTRREINQNIRPDPDLDTFMKAMATEGQEANIITDYVLKILGLEDCADTIVGTQMKRGISRGQRRRLTTGEMLVGPAKVLMMDEISTGLDSSTTFQIVNSLKQFAHTLNSTIVVSLLQPAPETYELFDDIVLLSEGQIVYQGPRETVLEFFESVGFECPERKGVADFLQEVTLKKEQRQYWARNEEPYHIITAKEFSHAFKSFHVGKGLGEKLAIPFDKSTSHPAALAKKNHGVGKKKSLKSCFSREVLLMKRNSSVHILKLAQVTITTTIVMAIFLRTNMNRKTVEDGGIYIGALVYSVMVFIYSSTGELAMTIFKLPVFYKHRNLLFFPSWAYALLEWILKIPLVFVEVAIWGFSSYYAIGYDHDVTRMFKLYLILLMIGQMANGLFRFIAGLGRQMIIANTFGSFALLLISILGGMILSRDKIKAGWIWGYWISPMTYAQNAVVVNELLGHSWGRKLSNHTESLGIEVLKARGFFTDKNWYWIGVGALLGYYVLFNIGYILALTFLDPLEKREAIIPERLENNQLSQRGSNNRTGMVLPFEPHSITFDNLTYSVDVPPESRSQGIINNKLVLLEGVSGAFRPRVLTALMGVSGAGKTILMDVLAGRKTSGYINGSIMISGYAKKQETFARISGYCEQNDIHSPHLTVYESLIFSAWLRLSAEVDAETRAMFIENVMELVELNPIKNALVGLPGVNALSIEQRKRLTIAVELVANPSIIFMDEPTSGLDARAAAVVMRAVRNMVDTGRTVVCTIHQPSIDVFESFDELLLLKRGGKVIYSGPLGQQSRHLVKYFEEIRGVSKIRDGCNPATWMLEVTGAAQETALGVDLAEVFKNSELYRRNKEHIDNLSQPASNSRELHFSTQYCQSFFVQCKAGLWKQHRLYWRNPTYTAIRILMTVITGLLFGGVFWSLGSKVSKKQDLFNALGSMYLCVLFIGPQNALGVQPVIAVERSVFYREKTAGMYSALAYAFAQVLVEIPYIFFQAVVYSVLVYPMVQFEITVTKCLWFLFFLFFSFSHYTFYGMMCVALTPNQQVGAILSSFSFTLWNLFSGFLIPRTRIPMWGRWYCYVCPTYWTLYGLLASQYADDLLPLSEGDETVKDFLSSYFGYHRELVGYVAVIVAGFAVAFASIFALSVKKLNFQVR